MVFVDEGKENALPVCERTVFNVHLNLGQRQIKNAADAGDDEEKEVVAQSSLTLYHCSDEDGTYKVTEVKPGPLEQHDLRSEVS